MKKIALVLLFLPSIVFADQLRLITKISEPRASDFRSSMLLQYPKPDSYNGTSDEWINEKWNEIVKQKAIEIVNYSAEISAKQAEDNIKRSLKENRKTIDLEK